MKKEQVLTQTKTLEGGEIMKKVEVVPDFYILGVNYEDLPDPKKIFEIREECNCWEMYGGPMCNNGGNYHSVIKVYEIPNTDYYLFVYGNTREDFIGDEYHGIIVIINGEPVYSITIRDDESYKLFDKDKAEKVIKSYAEDENYRIYYISEDE
ncbi:hypothetical protein [Thermocrinis sp.]|jgi:hypothetical protein|uniref:hypothetical protein n=1 Tax=Thermocrinis sp. TaxID=2024383 RepID=UPI003C005559